MNAHLEPVGALVDPSTIDHGGLAGLADDDHLQYFLLAGRAGGQSGFGSPVNGEDLTLAGNPGANPGFINLDSPVIFGPYTGNPVAAYGFDYSVVDNPAGAFIGGGLNFSGDITTGASTFIYESFRGAPIIRTAVAPGFAAYTVLQALPAFESGAAAGLNPLSPLIVNCGPTVRNSFVGAKTAATMAAINWSPTVAGAISGATMSAGSITGLINAPKYSTVAGSAMSFGIIRAIHCQNPAAGLFQPGAGTETMIAYYGLDMANITFATGALKSVVRSNLSPNANSRFLENNGNAISDFGLGHIYFDDAGSVAFGQVGAGNFDVLLNWQAAGYFRIFFANGNDDLRISSPGVDRFLFDSNGGSTTGEYNWNCAKFSLGAQTGSNGNQVGAFVAGTRSTLIAGEWADFLLTQAANITVDHAMGGVFGWGINAPSITLGTGTVTTAGALNVGGNVNQGSVNRFGIRVLSNPSGGSGINAALWITAGLSRFDGIVDINAPIALGGGAAATLGTIGGAGPTAAAQAQWVQIDINGVNHWIPAWT